MIPISYIDKIAQIEHEQRVKEATLYRQLRELNGGKNMKSTQVSQLKKLTRHLKHKLLKKQFRHSDHEHLRTYQAREDGIS